MNANASFSILYFILFVIDNCACMNATNHTMTECSKDVQRTASVLIIVMSSLFLAVSCYEIARENNARESE